MGHGFNPFASRLMPGLQQAAAAFRDIRMEAQWTGDGVSPISGPEIRFRSLKRMISILQSQRQNRSRHRLIARFGRGHCYGAGAGRSQRGRAWFRHGAQSYAAQARGRRRESYCGWRATLARRRCARGWWKRPSGISARSTFCEQRGIIRRAPAAEYSEEDWLALIDVNLTSVFRLMQHAGRHMLKQGSGKIINIASLLTFQGGILVAGLRCGQGRLLVSSQKLLRMSGVKRRERQCHRAGYMDTRQY